jgi:hypothetical protein
MARQGLRGAPPELRRSAEKEQFWQGHVARQRAGGLSVRVYCARQGLTEPSFYAWRRELARRDQARRSARPVDFVRLEVPEPSPARSTIEIVLKNEVRILVPAGAVRDSLREVLAALGVVRDAEPRPC